MKSLAVTIFFSACLAVMISSGCTGDVKPSVLGDEINLLEQKLKEGASFAEACVELEVLCSSTGFGCQAHEIFCKVPTKDYICQQLAAACVETPAACDVYNNHCGSEPPVTDGGITPEPDVGPFPISDSGSFQTDFSGLPSQCDPDGVGSCANKDDCILLDTQEKLDSVTERAQVCGFQCISNVDPSSCAVECLMDLGNGGFPFSSECADCYGAVMMCSLNNCLTHCAADPSSENCLRCQRNEDVTPPNTNGVDCIKNFYQCSGLLEPMY